MKPFDPKNPNESYDGMTAEEFAEMVRKKLAEVGLAHLLKDPAEKSPEGDPAEKSPEGEAKEIQTLTAIFVPRRRRRK